MVLLDLLFYTFVVVVFIQVIFYTIFFGRFAFSKETRKAKKKIAVSVIICAKNEAKNLPAFLPSIIAQSYPDFEIILINDASHDNTLHVMEQFADQYNSIKIVNVENNEAFWGNKKYALTLGIKASKNDFLLFTDADCKPLSKSWIQEMTSHFNNEKTIILGYGAYSKIKNSFLNKLIRFETLITALHYFSFAKIGIPYMGVGRNLAYRKDAFFNVKGFVNHMNILSGDDDLFVNQVATKTNTAICVAKNSFTESVPETSFRNWFQQKRRHISTANYYKLKHKVLLTLIYTSNFFFWTLGFTLIFFQWNWIAVISLFILRLIIQYVVIGWSTKKLNEKDLLIALPFLDFFLMSIQLIIFINNLIAKPNYWK